MDAETISLIAFGGGLATLAVLGSIVGAIRAALERREQAIRNDLAGREHELWEGQQHLTAEQERQGARELALSELVKQKTTGFPWLAEAYAEFLRLQDGQVQQILRTKRRPAPKAAETLGEISALRRSAEKRAKILEYVLRYYEDLFPWLPELRGEDVDELLIAIMRPPGPEDEREQHDPARRWLTDAEYRSLSSTERNQLALDRYRNRKKPPWEIGRDYERYVGYQYERDGYAVYYQGIVEGLEDLGRDLIARKDALAVVVQCKCWSSSKMIHEKHINQLFGTVTAYAIDNPDVSVSGVFCTTTALSARAKEFARKLGITYVEQAALKEYPRIKCNISRRTGERIYHLPFDQQYDRTVIEEGTLERYVETVAEAESLGFRRAFRWSGDSDSGAGTPSS